MADFTGFPLRIGACGALKLPLDVREQVTVTAERRPTDRLVGPRGEPVGFCGGSASSDTAPRSPLSLFEILAPWEPKCLARERATRDTDK